MMSFYEEFGVRNDASLEEIRQAYKTLARILHPDGQTDEKLKTAAARQMKRLHEILDILADSQKRRVYDETLIAAAYPDAALHWTRMEAVVRPPGKSGLGQSVLQHWSWILVGCVILGSGFWCITARGPVPLESARNSFSAAAPPPAGPIVHLPEPAPEQGSGRFVPGARLPSAAAAAIHPATPELLGLPAALAPPPMALSAPSPMPPSPRTPAALQPEKTVPPVPPVREASFAGEWFYAPSIEKPDPLLYAPEDIELRLTEKDGILNGEYRGRYKAPETGVPEDVVFKIQGKSSAGSSAALTWTSSDGAAGEINLNISRSDLMKVTWWATQLGRRPGLSSGAATLLRQQTP